MTGKTPLILPRAPKPRVAKEDQPSTSGTQGKRFIRKPTFLEEVKASIKRKEEKKEEHDRKKKDTGTPAIDVHHTSQGAKQKKTVDVQVEQQGSE